MEEKIMDGVLKGKFTLRVPKKVHKVLKEIAEKEGTSLNTLLNVIVSAALAQREHKQ
jgi:predicted HicB family RNase H-like nuclease